MRRLEAVKKKHKFDPVYAGLASADRGAEEGAGF
jgi:hypothetical protein